MAGSTAPAVKAAILAILDTVTALGTVSRTWAGPTKDEDFTGEMVFLGETNNEENWAELGAMRRRESYRIGVTVWVEQWGDDPQTAETRAYELWALVTDALTADLRQGGAQLLRAAGVDQFNQTSFRQITGPATAEKWGARIDAQVTFVARHL